MDQVNIPHPWEIRMSTKYQREFFYNPYTKESMWEAPVPTFNETAVKRVESFQESSEQNFKENSIIPSPRRLSRKAESVKESSGHNLSKLGIIPSVPTKPYNSNINRPHRGIINIERTNTISTTNTTISSSDSNDLSLAHYYGTTLAPLKKKASTPSNMSSANMITDFLSHFPGSVSEMIPRSASQPLDDNRPSSSLISRSRTPSPSSNGNNKTGMKSFNFISSVLPTNSSFNRNNSNRSYSFKGGSHFGFIRKRLHFMSRFSSSSSASSNISVNSPTETNELLSDSTGFDQDDYIQPPLLTEKSYEESDDEEEDKNKIVKIPIRVIGGLGRGGYSIVVKAEHMETKMKYALKIISKKRSCRPKDQDRLRRELKLMIDLDSKFLQRCHRCFESTSDIFFLLDFIDGGDLFFHLCRRQMKKKRGFSESEIRILLSEVFLGVEHLHKHGFIHRDLKIENIMLNRDGHLKLVDFGLAIEIDAVSSLCGSLLYMSPEMLKTHTIGRFTDWWSFGITFYELFTGHPPWSSYQNKAKIKREIMNIVVSPPTRLTPVGGKFLCGLLKHDYEDRLGTISDDEISSCSFFSSIDWEATRQGRNVPAFNPFDSLKKKGSEEGGRKSYVDKIKDVVNGQSLSLTQSEAQSGSQPDQLTPPSVTQSQPPISEMVISEAIHGSSGSDMYDSKSFDINNNVTLNSTPMIVEVSSSASSDNIIPPSSPASTSTTSTPSSSTTPTSYPSSSMAATYPSSFPSSLNEEITNKISEVITTNKEQDDDQKEEDEDHHHHHHHETNLINDVHTIIIEEEDEGKESRRISDILPNETTTNNNNINIDSELNIVSDTLNDKEVLSKIDSPISTMMPTNQSFNNEINDNNEKKHNENGSGDVEGGSGGDSQVVSEVLNSGDISSSSTDSGKRKKKNLNVDVSSPGLPDSEILVKTPAETPGGSPPPTSNKGMNNNDDNNEEGREENSDTQLNFFDEESSAIAVKEYLKKCSIIALGNRNPKKYQWKFGVEEISEYPNFEPHNYINQGGV